MGVEDLGERTTQIALAGRQPEDAARLVVDQHQLAGAVDGQHAVAHVRHQVPEEGVVDDVRGGDRRAMRPAAYARRASSPSPAAVPGPVWVRT